VANVVVSALATWNGKALKKAKQDVNVFDKQLKSLARTFGVTFSATAIVAFSKKAVRAFAEDEVAAKSLALQLENTGNAFRVNEVEDYIRSLEKTYAILTDLRRPFQTFLNLTRSVALSQRTLEAALNISAGTGQSLDTVVGALAAGIRGQTRALAGLNTGIDASIIKSGDMNEIMAELEKKFSGQASARLDTYSGKMDALKKSSDEATKAIGAGLVDALTILSKDKSIENLSDNFENLGNNIAFAIRELAKLVSGFNDLVSNPSFKAGLLALAIASKSPKAVAAAFAIIGGSAAAGVATRDFGGRELPDNARRSASRIELKTIKDSTKFRKLENEQLKKKTAVDELSAKFDVERIGFQKALNEATDEETKLRIRAQLAILDNNEALAKKILEELKAADAAKKLADALEASADKYDKMISGLIGQFRALGLSLQESMALAGMSARYQAQADAFAAGRGGGSGGGAAPLSTDPYDILIRQLAPELNASYGLSAQESISLATMSARYQAQADAITLRIDASGDKMSQAIAESIQLATRNGYNTSGAGQLP
jgi:hypothetical protein